MAVAGNDEATIVVIKKVKKVVGGRHHGGAWKVAYADFVTAMMAFFLLLWLLNATTEEQKKGIAEYFSPVTAFNPESVSKSPSGANGVMGGRTITSEGAMVNDTSPVGITVALPGSKDESEAQTEQSGAGTQESQQLAEGEEAPAEAVDHDEVDRLARELEQERFAQAEAELRQALESVPDLSDFARNLVIDQTPEGLRIQIIDQEGRSMFASGSAEMYSHMQRLLALVADAVKKLDNPVAIKGHTDAAPYANGKDYSNWELSTDRANSSRRALLAAGLPAERIASVVGRADQEHFVPAEPRSARNRRISIVLLRQAPDGASPQYKSGN